MLILRLTAGFNRLSTTSIGRADGKIQKTVKGSIKLQRLRQGKVLHGIFEAPIAAENYTAAEKKAFDEQGTKVYVNSEYVRLHEEVKVPYLVNSKTDFSKTANR